MIADVENGTILRNIFLPFHCDLRAGEKQNHAENPADQRTAYLVTDLRLFLPDQKQNKKHRDRQNQIQKSGQNDQNKTNHESFSPLGKNSDIQLLRTFQYTSYMGRVAITFVFFGKRFCVIEDCGPSYNG